MHFCRDQAEKGEICRRLRITHFIEDRPEVHRNLDASVHKLLPMQPNADPRIALTAAGAKPVHSWQEVLAVWLGPGR